MNKRLVKTSKFLSLVLRHKPESIGVQLDAEGWVPVDELLDACKRAGKPLTLEYLHNIVEQNDKKRFVIRKGKIRANQGHSLQINLNLKAKTPPDILFHGTASKFIPLIRNEGLRKMNRQHVHLSIDIRTARKVGIRHGNPIVLQIDARSMQNYGYEFYLSENHVWLTDTVPWEYITELDDTT